MLFQVILPALLAATVALASPINKRAWPAGDVTCGSNVYSLDEIKAATAAGYDQVDDPIGDSQSLFRLFVNVSSSELCRQLPTYVQQLRRIEHVVFFRDRIRRSQFPFSVPFFVLCLTFLSVAHPQEWHLRRRRPCDRPYRVLC